MSQPFEELAELDRLIHETAGLVHVDKTFERKTPVTRLSLTEAGREGIDQHWKQLDGLRRRAIKWQPARR